MSSEKLRNAAGSKGPRKRFADTDSVDDPEEVVAPESWRDEQTPTWGERLLRRKKTVAALGLIGAIVLGILTVYAGRYIISALTNPIVQSTLKYGAVLGVGFILGVWWLFGKLERVDELVLFTGEGVKRYVGDYDTDTHGNRVFEPYRGYSRFLKRTRKLTLGDLGGDLARAEQKAGRDEDDPVRIRLEDAITGSYSTDTGAVAASLTGGLHIDEYGRETDLYTAPPDLADEERYAALRDQLEYYSEKEIPSLEADVEDLEEKLAEVRERARRDTDESVEKFIGRVTDLEEARDRRRDRRAREGTHVSIGGPESKNGRENGKEARQ
mgnify:CR=1 FL=1